MQSTFDKITLDSARFWCLHVASQDECEDLFREIAQYFKSKNINYVIAQAANLDTVRPRFFRHPTCVEWFIQNADISPDDASTIIQGFPVNFWSRLSLNAMNPRRFLGLAAAIANNPDVIAYSTVGMDPHGISLIHEYAPAHFPEGCLIHVSAFPVGGGRSCPKGAQCVTIQFEPQ